MLLAARHGPSRVPPSLRCSTACYRRPPRGRRGYAMKNVLAVPALVAAIVIVGAASALAAPRANQKPIVREVSMDLDYKLGTGTETCYAPRGMEQRIMGALTYDPFGRETNPELHIGIGVVRQKDKFHAELTMTLADGNRLWVEELSDTNCVLLLGNVSVVVSAQVLIYVIKWPDKTPPSAPPAPPAEAPSAPPSPTVQPPQPPSPPPSAPVSAHLRAEESAPPPTLKPDPWTFYLGAGPEISSGLVPGTGVGGSVSLTAQRHQLALVAEARGHWTAWVADEAGRRDYGKFFGGAIAACWRRRWLGLCAPISVGMATQSIWIDDLYPSRSTPALGAAGWLSLRWQLKAGLSLQADGRMGVSVLTYNHHVNAGAWERVDSPVRTTATAGLNLLWHVPIGL